jgi:hypothetical protein
MTDHEVHKQIAERFRLSLGDEDGRGAVTLISEDSEYGYVHDRADAHRIIRDMAVERLEGPDGEPAWVHESDGWFLCQELCMDHYPDGNATMLVSMTPLPSATDRSTALLAALELAGIDERTKP